MPCEDDIAGALDRAKITRDPSAFTNRLFMSVAVGRAVLSQCVGQGALHLADRSSKALWNAAVDRNHLQHLGSLREHGWSPIRAMYPRAPGPLHLWAEDKHITMMRDASAPRVPHLCLHAVCCCGSSAPPARISRSAYVWQVNVCTLHYTGCHYKNAIAIVVSRDP